MSILANPPRKQPRQWRRVLKTPRLNKSPVGYNRKMRRTLGLGSAAVIASFLFTAQAQTFHAVRHDPVKAKAASHQLTHMSAFALRMFHKGLTTAGTGIAVTYDTRFGTGNVTINGTGGWFDFALHSGNRRIWVNGARPDDSGDGLSHATAKKTLDAGRTVFGNGSWTAGDQLMVASGSTYSTGSSWEGGAGGFCNRAGISATYPTVIQCYDVADSTNTAKYGKLTGTSRPTIQITNQAGSNMFSNVSADAGGSYAVQGIIFDCLNVDNAGVAYFQGSQHNDITFQNCQCNTGEITFEGSIQYDATGASYFQRINISKCAFFGSWTSSSNVAGCYFHATNGLYVQDNTWAHCGWKIGGTRDDGVLGGAAGTNHAHYFAAANKGGHFDRNFYVDSSYDANHRGNCDITSMASLDEPLVTNLGAFSGAVTEAPDGVTVTLTEGSFQGGAPLNASTPAGYGPLNTNTLSGSSIKNVAASDNPNPKPFLSSYNGGNAQNTSSITHVGTLATLTTSSAHGLTTGQHIYNDGASPTDYNASNVAITVISPTAFTYTMGTTPGTNATVVGKYTPQVPQYMLVDTVHVYNYESAWDAITWIPNQIHNTYTGIISDHLATGAGNQVASGVLLPNYKTRDQIITAVLTGMGVTPLGSYYARKAQLVNIAVDRPDLPIPQWIIKEHFAAMGLTPTYTSPAYQAYSGTPATIYSTALVNLSISTLNFVHGVSSSTLLSGVCANPVLTCADLPAGLSISGRTISGSAVSAGTPTIHVVETSQDGSVTHTTAFTLNIT